MRANGLDVQEQGRSRQGLSVMDWKLVEHQCHCPQWIADQERSRCSKIDTFKLKFATVHFSRVWRRKVLDKDKDWVDKGKNYVCRSKGEKLRLLCKLSSYVTGGSIMLWGCFAASGIRYITQKILKLHLKSTEMVETWTQLVVPTGQWSQTHIEIGVGIDKVG